MERPSPRRMAGYALFALLACCALIVLKFPYGALAERLVAEINATGKVRLSYENYRSRLLSLRLEFAGVRAYFPIFESNQPVLFGSIAINPAWDRLLLGKLGVTATAKAFGGTIEVTFEGRQLFRASEPKLHIAMRVLDLAALGLPVHGGQPPRGKASADAEFISTSQGLIGSGSLWIEGAVFGVQSPMLHDGSIQLQEIEADFKWNGNTLDVPALQFGPGDLQGELSLRVDAIKPFGRSRIAARGSVLVDPTVVNMSSVSDPGVVETLRQRRPLTVDTVLPAGVLLGFFDHPA